MGKIETHPDRLEISLRIAGGEVFAFTVESQSAWKGWIVVALIVMVVVAQVAASVGPELIELLEAKNG